MLLYFHTRDKQTWVRFDQCRQPVEISLDAGRTFVASDRMTPTGRGSLFECEGVTYRLHGKPDDDESKTNLFLDGKPLTYAPMGVGRAR